MNPRFENVSQMEANALGEEDGTCNLLLSRNRELAGVDPKKARWWLRVVNVSPERGKQKFLYFIDNSRQKQITRQQAQDLIDVEWGRK